MKASIFIATSLDGFIARANGDIDWLPVGGGEEHGYDGEKPVFVLSTGTLAPAPPGAVVEHMSGAPAEIVSQLAARGVRGPVLIGTGIPLFGVMERDLVLEHRRDATVR